MLGLEEASALQGRETYGLNGKLGDCQLTGVVQADFSIGDAVLRLALLPVEHSLERHLQSAFADALL